MGVHHSSCEAMEWFATSTRKNPQKRPIVGQRLPTLLRQGVMFLILKPQAPASASASAATSPQVRVGKEERWLLAKDPGVNLDHPYFNDSEFFRLATCFETLGHLL